MNIDTLRSKILKLKNKDLSFIYLSGRGQDESFCGRIVQVFPRVFLIKTINGTIKCFSYGDFLIKSLKIYL